MQADVEKLGKWIQESDNIVFFGGAGVSTESGIPDFRGEHGIYKAISEYGYPPEEILSHTFFMEHTDIFFDYIKKNLTFLEAKPNAAHFALAKLEKQGKVRAVITQNIDNLHQAAGSETVLELHGTMFRNYCMRCGKTFSVEDVMKGKGTPHCDVCGGIVRPDVVLYEEGLDMDVLNGAVRFISQADMLIVGGTSLNVYPAAGLIQYYQGHKLVLINQQPTPYDKKANLILREKIGSLFQELSDKKFF